jgi:hypothetical protein
MKTQVILLISLFALLLGACATPLRSASESGEPGFADESIFAGAPAEEPLPVGEEAIDRSNAADGAQRIVIKDASLEIVVNSPDESMQAIGEMADEMGGFIVSANLYQTRTSEGQEVPRAAITIRIPAERLDEALARIEAESDRLPLNKNINSQDVTSDYTDLQSRLTNLEAAEAQLVEILESANRTEDVLNVFEELTRVREQIEVLKGQILYYENSAKLSAVRVELIPNEAVQPISIGGWEPVGVVKDAVQTLIIALQGLVDILIWVALFILPILLIIGVPLFLIIRAIRNRRRRAKEKGATSGSGAQSTG